MFLCFPDVGRAAVNRIGALQNNGIVILQRFFVVGNRIVENMFEKHCSFSIIVIVLKQHRRTNV